MGQSYFNIKESSDFLEMVIEFNSSAIKSSRLVPVLVGKTGIAKTESVDQACVRKNMDNITLHLSQLEPADFVGLPEKTGEGFTRNCPPNWLPIKPWPKDKPLSEFQNNQGWIHPNGGVVFLDEMNRAPEDMRQACMQFLNTGRIHTYKLPDNYFVFAAMNPATAEGEYEVSELDEAGLNRIVQIKFRPDPEETLGYLTNKYGASSLILGWIKSDKNARSIDYGGDFEITDPKFSPRMLENAVKMYEIVKNRSKPFVRKCLGSLMDDERLEGFMTFKDQCDQFNYVDVIKGNKAKIEETILKQKRIDVVGFAVDQLVEVLVDYTKGSSVEDLNGKVLLSDKNVKEVYENITEFLLLCPDELKGALINGLKSSFASPKSIGKDKKFRETFKPLLEKYKSSFE
jgi:hypothetical protein